MVNLPSLNEKQMAVINFMEDLKSYHVEVGNGKELKPVICAVCDSIAKSTHWGRWISISPDFIDLCEGSNLRKSRIEENKIYRDSVLHCYTAPYKKLEDYILSPRSIIDNENILVCKDCLSHMEKEAKKRIAIKYRKPPKDAIANGYLIGDAPEEINCLNEVELVLVSKVKIHSYIWIYFAGCHQQIRGWHTFYKNRPTANISSLQTVNDSGLKGDILVILCGPFTSTQKAIAMKETRVRPEKVIAAFEWLVENNCYYNKDDIPDPNDLPYVQVIEENV